MGPRPSPGRELPGRRSAAGPVHSERPGRQGGAQPLARERVTGSPKRRGPCPQREAGPPGAEAQRCNLNHQKKYYRTSMWDLPTSPLYEDNSPVLIPELATSSGSSTIVHPMVWGVLSALSQQILTKTHQPPSRIRRPRKKIGVPFPSQILWENHQKELQDQLVGTAHFNPLWRQLSIPDTRTHVQHQKAITSKGNCCGDSPQLQKQPGAVERPATGRLLFPAGGVRSRAVNLCRELGSARHTPCPRVWSP